MRYYKFNNSRSTKTPYFEYSVGAELIGAVGVGGNRWTCIPMESVEISKEEFDIVKKAWIDTVPKSGDEVVISGFVTIRGRFGTVESIIGECVKLIDGRSLRISEVRSREFYEYVKH